MAITAALVKELREKTGVGMMECKQALTECNGDIEAAIKNLREKGIAGAGKRAERAVKEGLIWSYIHPGNRIGVLVEVNCETDFVARNPAFQDFAKNVAMHIAAQGPGPLYLRRDEVPQALIDSEKEIYRHQALNEGKKPEFVEKIVDGRVNKFFAQVCIEEQPFIRDQNITVGDLLKETISKFGENMSIRRFARFRLGEE